MSQDLQLQLGPISPRELIDDAVRKVARSYQEDQVELVSEIDPTTPRVLADRERVGLALACLLRNARAHTPAGGAVKVRAEPCDSRVRFSVVDAGGGIPAAHRERIFEPFFQVPGTEHLGEVGLGLAVCRQIVEAHGGEIDFESEEGRGTSFWFMLPAQPSQEEPKRSDELAVDFHLLIHRKDDKHKEARPNRTRPCCPCSPLGPSFSPH